MARRRKFTPEFNAQMILAILSIEKSIRSRIVYSIAGKASSGSRPQLFGKGQDTEQQTTKIVELKRMMGKLTMQLEIAKKPHIT